MDNLTRLFFLVQDNAEGGDGEIYETYQEAEAYYKTIDEADKPTISIAMVENAYREQDTGIWNYADYSNTFKIIKVIDRWSCLECGETSYCDDCGQCSSCTPACKDTVRSHNT